jgi:hypothetical protein
MPGSYVQSTLSGSVSVNATGVGANPNPWGPSELQVQGGAAAALNTKIMYVGDSIVGFVIDELYAEISGDAAGFAHFDFVGNNNAPPKDMNGYGGYKFRDLLVTAGTGTKYANSGNKYYGDASDLDNWLVGQSPDIVLLHGTTNDGQDVVDCLAAYSLIVSKVRATNPSVRFFVAQIIPELHNLTWSTTFNAAIPAWSAANSTPQSPIIVVDQHTGYDPTIYDSNTNPTGMSRDGTHPTSHYAPGVGGPDQPVPQPVNLTGAYHMARVWLAALRPYLRSVSTP